MQATKGVTLSADRRSARRWRTATGLALVIAIVSLTLALTRARQIEHVPMPVREVSPMQVAITSSAATHEAGPYAPTARVHVSPRRDWTKGAGSPRPEPSAQGGRW